MSRINELLSKYSLSEDLISRDVRADVNRSIIYFNNEMPKLFSKMFSSIAVLDEMHGILVFKVTNGDTETFNKILSNGEDIKMKFEVELIDYETADDDNTPLSVYSLEKKFIDGIDIKCSQFIGVSVFDVTKKLVAWFKQNKNKIEEDV